MLHNIEKITPKLADKYLRINTRNRAISKSQLGFLIREIETGNWLLNGLYSAQAANFLTGNID